MMYKTVQSAHSRGIFVQASLERMMKCGVGICGSCCVGEDLACKDGTVFDGNHLFKNNEFNFFTHNVPSPKVDLVFHTHSGFEVLINKFNASILVKLTYRHQ